MISSRRLLPRLAMQLRSRSYATPAHNSLDKLALSFVLPHKALFASVPVDSVTIPASSGIMTVLPQHVPIVESLASGVVEVTVGGENSRFFVSSGFATVHKDSVMSINAVEAFPLDAFHKDTVVANLAQANAAVAAAPAQSAARAEAEIEVDVFEAILREIK